MPKSMMLHRIWTWPCGLHIAAHDAEAEYWLSVFGHEGGDDRVEWSLARFVGVGMFLRQVEQRPAVLESEPQSIRAQPAAEAVVVALDQ